MHADHHGGLYPLLLRRQELLQQHQRDSKHKPLLIMGPWPLFRVLSQYGDALGLQFRFLPNTYFGPAKSPHEPPAAALAAYEAAREVSGLTVLEPFPVQHVAHSTGLRLESKDGWKMVFSGKVGCRMGAGMRVDVVWGLAGWQLAALPAWFCRPLQGWPRRGCGERTPTCNAGSCLMVCFPQPRVCLLFAFRRHTAVPGSGRCCTWRDATCA
jgi:hypothetical protein